MPFGFSVVLRDHLQQRMTNKRPFLSLKLITYITLENINSLMTINMLSIATQKSEPSLSINRLFVSTYKSFSFVIIDKTTLSNTTLFIWIVIGIVLGVLVLLTLCSFLYSR